MINKLILIYEQPAEMSLEEIESKLGSLIQAETITQLKSAVWKERLEGFLSLCFFFFWSFCLSVLIEDDFKKPWMLISPFPKTKKGERWKNMEPWIYYGLNSTFSLSYNG